MTQNVGSIEYTVSMDLQPMMQASKDAQKLLVEMSVKIDQVDRTAAKAGNALNGMAKYVKAAFAVGAIKEFVTVMVDAQLAADKLNRLLQFTNNGSLVGIARDMEYLHEVTDRLGLDFATASVAYAKFQAASRGTAVEGETARKVFGAVSKASTVMGLSAEDAQGVFLALSQIMSKGTVQAEELRGQLGERLPGAMAVAARAVGVTEAEFNKLLETGQVLAEDFIPRFAAQLEREIGTSATGAVNSLQAAINRLNSQWLIFKQNFSDSAFIKGTIATLADALKLINQGDAGAGSSRATKRRQTIESRLADPSVTGAVRKQLEIELYLLDKKVKTLDEVTKRENELAKISDEETKKLNARRSLEKQDAAYKSELTKQADKVRKSLATPAERLKQELDQQQEFYRRGVINLEEFEQNKERIRAKYAEKTKSPRAQYDSEGYLAGLRASAASGSRVTAGAGPVTKDTLIAAQTAAFERLAALEQKALLNNKRLLTERKLSYTEYEQAVTLIADDFANQRDDISRRSLARASQFEDERLAAIKFATDRQRNLDYKAGDAFKPGDTQDQLDDKTRAKGFDVVQAAQEREDRLNEMRIQGLIDEQTYQQALVDTQIAASEKLREIAEERAAFDQARREAMLMGASDFFGQSAELVKSFAGESSTAYKALFAVSKGFAIANATLNLLTAISNASNAPWPTNFGFMAQAAAQGAALVGQITSLSYGGGRQYGGAVSRDRMYRVNETGAPEMFRAPNGSQYMLPNTAGQVVPAGAAGAGVVVNISNNVPGVEVKQTGQSDDGRIIEIAVTRAVQEVAGQLRSNSGPVWQAARGSTNIQGRV